MKSVLTATLIGFASLTSFAGEITVEGAEAEKVYDSFQGKETMIGYNRIVKVGDGIVCWLQWIEGTTDIQSVRCTLDESLLP